MVFQSKGSGVRLATDFDLGASSLISLCLSFPICQMGVIIITYLVYVSAYHSLSISMCSINMHCCYLQEPVV